MPLKYEDLWETWAEAREQPKPTGFKKIKEKEGLKSYYLAPEDMSKYINAFSPFNLYMNPSSFPIPMDYPSVGFNITDRLNPAREVNLLASKTAPLNISSPNLIGMKEYAKNEFRDIPGRFKSYIPQAIYEHELEHYLDPRINPELFNYGYLMKYGLPGNIAGREEPAMRAEDLFWDYIRRVRR